MSRFRLTFSLGISSILILSALWFRVSNAQTPPPSLIAVQNQETAPSSDLISYEDWLAQSSSTAQSGSLSQTDLIGRQLFSDYMGLVNNGQATPQNLTLLADSYAKNISDQTSAIIVKAEDINTVTDTVENLRSYSEKVSSIRNKSKDAVIEESKNNQAADTSNPAFAPLMNKVASIYESSANELKAIQVPISLRDNHVLLINNYLSSAEAMKDLAKSETDPVSAYAALNTQANNNTEEIQLLQNIQTTLMANGIIFESDI